VLNGVSPLYVEQFRASHPYLADWAQTVESYRREELEIQAEVPSSVNFGVFQVSPSPCLPLCLPHRVSLAVSPTVSPSPCLPLSPVQR
jgi:hypothetical protein